MVNYTSSLHEISQSVSIVLLNHVVLYLCVTWAISFNFSICIYRTFARFGIAPFHDQKNDANKEFEVPIANIFMNPNYYENGHDIALVELKNEINFNTRTLVLAIAIYYFAKCLSTYVNFFFVCSYRCRHYSNLPLQQYFWRSHWRFFPWTVSVFSYFRIWRNYQRNSVTFIQNRSVHEVCVLQDEYFRRLGSR